LLLFPASHSASLQSLAAASRRKSEADKPFEAMNSRTWIGQKEKEEE